MRGRYPVSCRTLLTCLAVGWVALLFLVPVVITAWPRLLDLIRLGAL